LNINKTLNIYVLNWNQPNITINCIHSLKNMSSPINYEIIIIDNGSTDSSIKKFEYALPEIKIIKNKANLGYQGGMNAGIHHAQESSVDYVMLLNNDTIADPNMLTILFKYFPEDASLASPGIYFYENRSKLCSLGGNYHRILLDVFTKPNAAFDPPSDIQQYEFLPSHAWLIKTEVFKKVGMFDEAFFPIYYDDLDYCLRMKRAGLKLYLIPQAKIYHLGSMSVGGRNSPRERCLMARNSAYYFKKNMHFWQAPFIFLFRLTSGLIWTFRLMKNKNIKAIVGFWKGFFEGWFKKSPTTK
jgi:GT2 family glycosyltransferase